jgi:hypothetical protein
MKPKKGGEHKDSVLTEECILPILQLIHDGVRTEEVSNLYGVNTPDIRKIVEGRGWKHITRPLHLTHQGILKNLAELRLVDRLDKFMEIVELSKVCKNSEEIENRMGISRSVVCRIYKQFAKRGLECQKIYT